MNKSVVLIFVLFISPFSFAETNLEQAILGQSSSELKQQANGQQTNKHHHRHTEPYYRHDSRHRLKPNINNRHRIHSNRYPHDVYSQHEYHRPDSYHSPSVVVYYFREDYDRGHWHDDFWCDDRHDYYDDVYDSDYYDDFGYYDWYDDWFFD